MRYTNRWIPWGCLTFLLVACTAPRLSPRERADAEAAVAAVLDEMHAGSEHRQPERYFGQFASDAVVLGTAKEERFDLEAFREFAAPFLEVEGDRSRKILERHVRVAECGRLAWFDERVEKALLGEMRGSGVLRWDGERWEIVHYNASFPIPNELVPGLVTRIQELEHGQ
jgi:hypothetical protein